MPLQPIQPANSTLPAKERFKREITLISRGYSAPAAFPDGKIIVYPWDIKMDEWLLNRSKKGKMETALLDALPMICNLNGCPPGDFVAEEVMLISMVSRSILRENALELKLTCPECTHQWVERLTVPNQLGVLGEKTANYEPGSETTTLPVCRDVVAIKPILIHHYRDATAFARQHTISDRICVLAASIVSVGGGTPDSPQEVINYLSGLHPRDFPALERAVRNITPQLDPEVDVTCTNDECEHEFKHTISFALEFFRFTVAE